MQFFNTVALLFAAVVPFSTALDQPKSVLHHTNARFEEAATTDRGLLFLGAAGCGTQLDTCQNALQLDGFSVESMLNMVVTYLGSFDNDPNDSLLSDLLDVLLNAGSVNFNTLEQDIEAVLLDMADDAMDSLFAMAQGAASTAVSEFVAPRVEDGIKTSVRFVSGVVGSTVGPLFSEVAPVVTQVLDLLESVDALNTFSDAIAAAGADDAAAPEGEAATAQATNVAIRDINAFLASSLATAVSTGVPRSQEAQAEVNTCAAALMECNYNALMAKITPLLVGTVISADATHMARRRALAQKH